MLFSPARNRTWILTDPSSVRECALAMAIPMDRAAFERELESPQRNFVLQTAGGGARILPRQVLWENYRPLAEAALEVAEAYGQAGAQVINATCEALTNAFRKYRIVTLFAHWKTSDPGIPIPLDVQDVLELLMTSGQPGPRLIRDGLGMEYFRPRLASLAVEGGGVEAARGLSAKLVEFFTASPGKFPFELRGGSVCRSSGRRILFGSRTAEEFLVPGIHSSTGRIELADEICSRERFIAAIPASFHGLIDLALCHSWEMANFVRTHRRCHVAVAGNPVSVLPRLRVQKEVLRLIGKGRLSYAQSLLRANAKQRIAPEGVLQLPMSGPASDSARPDPAD